MLLGSISRLRPIHALLTRSAFLGTGGSLCPTPQRGRLLAASFRLLPSTPSQTSLGQWIKESFLWPSDWNHGNQLAKKNRPQMLRTFTSELPNHLRGPLVHSKRILFLAGGRQFCDILRVCFHDHVGSANWLCVPDLNLFASTTEIVAHYFFAVHSRNLFHGLFKIQTNRRFFSIFSVVAHDETVMKYSNTPRLRSQKTGEALRMSAGAMGHHIRYPLVNVYIAMENHNFNG